MPSWLSRSPTLAPQLSKSLKISEPKLTRSIDLHRLGFGATVVRTPDDALKDTGVRITYQTEKAPKHKLRANSTSTRPPPFLPPTSPPLPPLPLPEEDEERQLQGDSVITAPRSPRLLPPPDLHRTPSKRSSLKFPKPISLTHSSSSSDDPPSVPPLPSHVAASTQPPPFSPVLITLPSSRSTAVNPEKVIVTLETCTHTYRTTLSTLTSRQSHLAKYLSTLYAPPTPIPNPIAYSISSSSSSYSTQSDNPGPVHKHHLNSQPLVLVPLTSTVHIFLDRPSAPYAHILSYLRQPFIGSQPESLPYALQLHNYTSSTIQASSPSLLQSKLDTLIEVRDEAAYLSLDGLHRLCIDEIKNRYNPKFQTVQIQAQAQGHHIRGLSSSSIQSLHSLQASIYNLHPLQEKAEAEVDASPASDILNSTSSSSIGHPTRPESNNASSGPGGPSPAAIAIRRRSKQTLGPSSENIVLASKTPPTPRSIEGHHGAPDQSYQQSQSQSSRSRSSSRSRLTHTAGWI